MMLWSSRRQLVLLLLATLVLIGYPMARTFLGFDLVALIAARR
ncbi:MAG: hypothetical protein U1E65_34995 [Myxococcota bacterium]